ncbi:MAG TPA: triple tyrosine motif-containing protein [Saprospiraceae bacterium]|nr:triple tyrosine motif-containing protein [Saprospiraceae bacterium]
MFGRAFLVLQISMLHFTLSGSELPPLIKYSTNDYKAGNQNWKISQDNDRVIYFANNDGLLEFNGAIWTLYPSPNETIIRAVKVVGKKVFTGCYKEFGYWERHQDGKLRYNSLSKIIENQLLEDEHVWEILNFEDWVLFQTLHRIYFYNLKTGAFKIINPANGVWRVFILDKVIYYQTLNEGLYRLKGGVSELINKDNLLKNNQICNIFDINNDLFLQTEKAGLFILKEGKLIRYEGKNDRIVNQNDIFSCIRLANGQLVLGTISNGVFILENDFDLMYHITQDKGLSNNTALSLFEDFDKNLWIGLDNGINCVNLNSTFKCYVDKSGILGTVYTSKLYKGILYLGTNQGLFAKTYGSDDEFRLVGGIKGQVWTLFIHEGVLFCGHNRGTYLIDGFSQRKIYSASGTWKFSEVPGIKNVLIQGNYNGLNVLKKVGDHWIFSNKIKNFDISSRYFEIGKNLKIYISHEYKGVIRLNLDHNLTQANGMFLYSFPKKGKNSGFIKYGKEIIYASRNGYFKLNNESGEFEPEKSMMVFFEQDGYISGKMSIDKNNRLWIFTNRGLEFFYKNNIDPEFRHRKLFLDTDFLKSISGYENIEQLNDSDYLIGTADGYFIFKLTDLIYSSVSVRINGVAMLDQKGRQRMLELGKDLVLSHKDNNLRFEFSIPKYNKYIKREYKYFLEGYSTGWTIWQNNPVAIFRKLPPGKYTFFVKGRHGDRQTESVQSVSFRIRKPFYETNGAIMFYAFILILGGYLINKSYEKNYEKQKNKLIAEHNLKMEIQQLENEQQLMMVRNQELSQFVDEKSKELAVSNLDLIRKNELLKMIRDDIKKHKNSLDLNKFLSLLSGINENISGKDSWDTFMKSFDSFDKDFLKRLHEVHPTLSPSDLKLCAYLRINLVSKEIAPLLNISERSVEIKRYRLRKKLNLHHDVGLASYLINF